ncbi:MAG: hypothetical protein WCG29_13720, partial [Desulfomonile sp.]
MELTHIPFRPKKGMTELDDVSYGLPERSQVLPLVAEEASRLPYWNNSEPVSGSCLKEQDCSSQPKDYI